MIENVEDGEEMPSGSRPLGLNDAGHAPTHDHHNADNQEKKHNKTIS